MIRVFLSHNSADKPQVEHLAHKLQQEGFTPWLDAWNLSPGDKWQEGLEQGLLSSQICIVFIGKHGRGPWHDAEICVAIDRNISHKKIRVIPVLLPDAPDSALSELPAFLQSYNAERFSSLDDKNSFRRLCAGIREEAPGPDIDRKTTTNPYRGLDFFDIEHAAFFHGREEITGRLLDLLRPKSDYSDEPNNRFLAIIGASGSGKSSIARAGLLAALQGGRIEGSDDWPQVICTPGKEPLESLAIALNSHRDLKSRWDTHDLIEKFKTHPLQLHYSTLELLQGDKRRRLVLLIDQFEEIFTLCENNEDRGTLVSNILQAAKEETGQLIVVITLRADFYSHCTSYPELSRYFEAQQRLLNPMTEQELRAAIELPARQVGCELEQGLVDVIIADAQQQPGTLPLLQYALMRLWDQSSARVLRLKDYQAFGGLGGALEQRANELYEEFPKAMQDQCRLIFRRLVQPGEGTTDTRRRSRLEELGGSTETLKVVQTLTDARLLTTQDSNGTAFVEVSHEALIREWSQLQEWIEEDRADLRLQHQITSAAQDWHDHNQEASWLLTGARLAAAVEWGKDNSDSANELETAFIITSKHEEEAQQQAETKLLEKNAELEKQRRIEAEKREEEQHRALTRSRWMSRGMALLTIAMLVAAGFAYQSEQKATLEALISKQSKEETAQALVQVESEQEKTKRALEETAQALVQVESEQEKTKRALKEAELERKSAENNAIEAKQKELEANFNLAKAFEEKSLTNWEDMSSDSQKARAAILFALDAQTKDIKNGLVTLTPPKLSKLAGINEQQLFSARKITASLNLGSIDNLAYSQNGKLVATAKFDFHNTTPVISIWDIDTGKQLNALSGHRRPISSLAFNFDGNQLLSGSADNTVKLWDVSTGKEAYSFRHSEPVSGVAFRPNSNQIASSSYLEQSIRIHDTSSKKLLLTIKDSAGNFSYSPDGKFIAGVSFSTTNSVKLWDSESGNIVTTFNGHTQSVKDLVFSPDGLTLATVSYDKSVRFWRLSDGKEVYSLSTGDTWIDQLAYNPNGDLLALVPTHSSRIFLWDIIKEEIHDSLITSSSNNIAFSPDGKSIIAAGYNSIELLDIEKNSVRYSSHNGHKADINTVAYHQSDNIIISAGWDGIIRSWDTNTGLELNAINSKSRVKSLCFTPDGKQFVAELHYGVLAVLNTKKRTFSPTTLTDEFAVNTLACDPMGNHIATGPDVRGNSKTIKIWDVSQGTLVLTSELKLISPTLIQAIKFNHDGTKLVSGGKDGLVIIWDVTTGKILQTIEGSPNIITDVSFSPDGEMIVSASNSTIKFWNVNTGSQKNIIHTESPVSKVHYKPSGEVLATALNNGTINLWNSETGKLINVIKNPGIPNDLVFSPDGSRLVSGFNNGTLKTWDIKPPAPEKVLQGHTKWIPVLTFEPNGKTLISGSADHTIRLWDLETQEFKSLNGHTRHINALVVRYDEGQLISASDDKKIIVWDIKTGKAINSFKQAIKGNTQITALSLTGNKKTLITGNADGKIQEMDFTNGNIIRSFKGHNRRITSLSLSPNGRTLLSSSQDNKIFVWDIISGEKIQILDDHLGDVNSLAFNPSGEIFASGSGDETIRVWDTETLKTLKILRGHTKQVVKVTFSPDGKTLTSSSRDNTLHQWDVETGKITNILQGGYIHAHHPTKKMLASAYGSVIRLWDQTDPIYRLLYDFDPGIVSEALKFIWQLELNELEYRHADYPISLEPEMGYHFVWTNKTRKFRPLLDMPNPDETKIEQVVRWLDEQKAYRNKPAGVATIP